VFVAGQVGWDENQRFQSEDIVPQFEQALKNIVAVLAEAGARPEHICRMTAYCCDKPAYLAARRQLGKIWMQHIGRHFPAMSMIFVSDLLDNPGKIELEATAVVPAAPVKRAARRKPAGARRAAKRATTRRRRARS
jgi:enamine deaminase RidA (YjgF/YER057c/UK114 family)